MDSVKIWQMRIVHGATQVLTDGQGKNLFSVAMKTKRKVPVTGAF